MRTTLFCLLGALSASPMLAQNIKIFPSDHTNVEGASSNTDFPFSAGLRRTQIVYDRWDTKVPNNASIRQVGVRPDGLTDSPTAYKVQLEISMGHSTKEIPQLTGTFANNYDGAPVVVFSKKIFSPPTITKPATPPSTSYVMVLLDTPFTYDANKNLIVDWKVYANSNGNQPWTYTMDNAGALSTVAKLGTGCMNSANTIPDHTSSPAELGAYWSFSVKNLLANSPIGIVIGLAPASPPVSLAPIGAPGCFAYLDLAKSITFGARAYGNGTHSSSLPLPYLRQLYGQTLYSQYVCVDVFANNLGIITSNAGTATLGIVPQMAFIDSRGNPDATYGGLYAGAGYTYPVCVFEHN